MILKKLEKLMNFEQHPELKNQFANVIPMISNNGIKIVDPVFIKDVQDSTPLELSKKMINKGFDADYSKDILNLHFKNAILKTISSLSQDFETSDYSFEEYIKTTETLGFKEVARTEDSKIAFLWNDQYSMMWKVKNYQGKADCSTIYFQGVKRNPNIHHNMPISHCIAYNTNVSVCCIDVRSMPSARLTEILEKFIPVHKWIENHILCDEIEYVAHKMPKHVQDSVYGFHLKDAYKETQFTNDTQIEFTKKVDSIISDLSEDDKLITVAVSRSYEYTSVDTDYASNVLRKLLIDYKIEEDERPNYISVICQKLSDSVDNFLAFEYLLNNGEKTEIEPMYLYLLGKSKKKKLDLFTEQEKLEKLELKMA